MRYIYDSELERQEEAHLAACVRGWMLRNYSKHLTEVGAVDAESLAEQANWEFNCGRELADDLAAIVAAEVDR